MLIKNIPEEERQKRPNPWLRPQDIKRWYTSDLKEMTGKYLSLPARREWTEDFIDEDTGETVPVKRGEIVLDAGTLLTNENVSTLNFYFQTGDIKQVEISDYPIPRPTESVGAFYPTAVTFYDQTVEKYTFFCHAQTLTQAMDICMDFANCYRGLSHFTPIKVTRLGADLIQDDDPCIPEKEQVLTPVYSHQYYKVSARLTYLEINKMENIDRDFIIAAEDVGESKVRVARYCRTMWKERLEGPDNVQNSMTIRKSAPVVCDALVPATFCTLYKIE